MARGLPPAKRQRLAAARPGPAGRLPILRHQRLPGSGHFAHRHATAHFALASWPASCSANSLFRPTPGGSAAPGRQCRLRADNRSPRPFLFSRQTGGADVPRPVGRSLLEQALRYLRCGDQRARTNFRRRQLRWASGTSGKLGTCPSQARFFGPARSDAPGHGRDRCASSCSVAPTGREEACTTFGCAGTAGRPHAG